MILLPWNEHLAHACQNETRHLQMDFSLSFSPFLVLATPSTKVEASTWDRASHTSKSGAENEADSVAARWSLLFWRWFLNANLRRTDDKFSHSGNLKYAHVVYGILHPFPTWRTFVCEIIWLPQCYEWFEAIAKLSTCYSNRKCPSWSRLHVSTSPSAPLVTGTEYYTEKVQLIRVDDEELQHLSHNGSPFFLFVGVHPLPFAFLPTRDVKGKALFIILK